MTAIRFLVSKYIADIQRMEPKNIGIIAWHDGLVDGRFAGEADGQLKPPRIVDSTHRKGYIKSVQSWRLQFAKPSLPLGGGEDDAPRSSVEFLEALKMYSTRHFMIGEGGHVAVPSALTLKAVIDELFTQLIDDSAGQDGMHRSALIQSCDEIALPLEGIAGFHKNIYVSANVSEDKAMEMARLKSSPKQRYLLAKYAADVRRMEARNIGVILWTPRGLGCKFLTEDAASFVDDMKMYRRWISFWTDTISQNEMVKRGGIKVSQDQPEFLDMIIETQRGGFLLCDAGHVTDKINKRDISKAVGFLFDELVGSPAAQPGENHGGPSKAK